MTPHEKELLTALHNAGAEASVADILRRNHQTATPQARKALSSRLCKLRDKGLATSYQQDGVNYWSWTVKGLTALNGDISADIPAPETAPESSEIQPNEPDIVPDIPDHEPPRFESVHDIADDINPALVQESVRIRPVAPFARINDALFVLDTLAIAYCHGMPAYQTEITRIADYLREVAA